MKRSFAPLLIFALVSSSAAASEPRDAFFASLETLCHSAFHGELAAGFEGRETVYEGRLILDFFACDDDSLTADLSGPLGPIERWTISRGNGFLSLKHVDPDTEALADKVIGGSTEQPGTATRQVFPADQATKKVDPRMATYVWTLEIESGRELRYIVRREDQPDHFYKLRFDLSRSARSGDPELRGVRTPHVTETVRGVAPPRAEPMDRPVDSGEVDLGEIVKEEGCTEVQMTLLQTDRSSQYREIWHGIEPPKPIRKVLPEYSAEALRARVEGSVVYELLVDADGRVQGVCPREGLPAGMTQRSITALKQWTFSPASADGHPVAVFFRVELEYVVRDPKVTTSVRAPRSALAFE